MELTQRDHRGLFFQKCECLQQLGNGPYISLASLSITSPESFHHKESRVQTAFQHLPFF